MQSKLFVAARLSVLALTFLMFLPTAQAIRETILRSDTRVQMASTTVDSQTGERMMSFAEVNRKNTYNAGLRLPDPSIMLFVGLGLVGVAVWAKHRAKRTVSSQNRRI